MVLLRFLLFILFGVLIYPAQLQAQIGLNAPVGVSPTQDVEVYTRNGFLVQEKYTRTTADPAAYTATMSCPNSPSLTALAGTLKDPSGDANYTGGVVYNCSASISTSDNTVKGLEIIFTDLNTDPVNSTVVITDIRGNSQQFTGNTLPGRIVIPFTSLAVPDPIALGAGIVIHFQTNSSVASGRGFSLQWRALLFNATTASTSIAISNAMQFDVNAGSFKTGHNNTASGKYSTAMGYYNFATGYTSTVTGSSNTASGDNSTAMGFNNTTSGSTSTAFGSGNTTSGSTSTAFGSFNTASGVYSSALGVSTLANGQGATTIGQSLTASGTSSMALGTKMNTNTKQGAFMIGDSDPLFQGATFSGLTDQFVARFLNGYFLLTSGDLNPGGGTYGTVRTGVVIARGQNSWGSVSDSTKKERFLPIDHSVLLRKIGAMKLTTWNYKGQHLIRHYGPMAQDFYAAFGQDGLGQVGCDTLIYSHDFAGVTFAGVQALIRENERLKTRLAALEEEKQQTEAQLNKIAAYESRLEALEARLNERTGQNSISTASPSDTPSKSK